MYTKSARFYDLIYGFKDYVAESAKVHAAIQQHAPPGRRLLDVACGTGKHLELLTAWYDVEGLDINAELLVTARRRCPDVPLHHADMIDFDLGRSFDVIICMFSSIAYLRTVDRMRAALRSMRRHLAPGGVLLLEPWFAPERYWTGTITANVVDEPDMKIVWMYTSDPPEGRIATLDIHYLVGTPAGVDYFTEPHELGLFTDEEYREAIEDTGLSVAYDPEGPMGRGLFIGRADPG